LAVVLLSTIHQTLVEQSWNRRFLLSVVLLLLLTMPVFYTFQRSTRYIFFFFPLVLLLAYAETASLVAWIDESHPLARKKYISFAILLVPIACYTATEDFQWRHILNVSSAQMNFRMGEYDRYFHHWYQRVDFESPSRYVNREFSKGDVAVADHIVMTRYLDRPFTYYVYSRQPEMYPYHARKEGREEKWTGRPLISRPEELAGLVPMDPNRSLWLVTSLVKDHAGSSFTYPHHNVITITDQYNLHAVLVFKGLDGRIGVWKITRPT
jgi:(2Fe-2S) ferredoxin